MSALRSPVSLTLMARGYIFLLVVSILFNSFSSRMLPGQKELFAVVVAYCFVMCTAPLLLRAHEAKLFIGLAVLNLAWLFLAVTQDPIIFRWVIGDFLIVSAPLLICVFLRFSSVEVTEGLHRGIMTIVVPVLLLSALLAIFFPDNLDRGRFEPPDYILIAITCSFIFFGGSGAIRLVATVAFVVILAITYYSQGRMAFGIALAMPLLFFVLSRRRYRNLLIIAILCSLFLLLNVGTLQVLAEAGFIQESRFASLASGVIEDDRSALFRLIEINHVLSYIRTSFSVLDWFFGLGHGAHFPGTGLVAESTLQYYERNVVDDRIHNIHIGGGWILLRYGLIGLVGYFTLIVILFLKLWRHFSVLSHLDRACSISALLFLITTLLLYNEWSHITFHLALAFGLTAKPRLDH